MDRFEEAMQEMAAMPDEERSSAIERNRKLCTCPECPSYNECAKGKSQLLFCATGKSNGCITDECGCICPACPVAEMLGLKKIYFCTKGTEKEQRGL